MLLNTIAWIALLAASVVSPASSICIADANGADPYVAYYPTATTSKLPLYLNQGGGVLASTTSKGIGLQATLSKEPLLALWSYSNTTGIIRAFHGCSNLVLNVGPSPPGGIQPYKRQDASIPEKTLTPVTWGQTSTTKWSYIKQGNTTVIGVKYAVGQTNSIPPSIIYATYSTFYACKNNVGTWSLYLVSQQIYEPLLLTEPTTDITGAAITVCQVTQIAVVGNTIGTL